jgi:hypothetical protein
MDHLRPLLIVSSVVSLTGLGVSMAAAAPMRGGAFVPTPTAVQLVDHERHCRWKDGEKICWYGERSWDEVWFDYFEHHHRHHDHDHDHMDHDHHDHHDRHR